MKQRSPVLSAAKAGGFGLVSAIFVLIVLSGLAYAMVSLQTSQAVGGALDVRATRAYLAARSGLEWGLWRSLRATPALPCANNSYSFQLPGTTLNGFTVTVQCTSTVVGAVTTRTLTSTACSAPDADGNCPATGAVGQDYVERQIVASFQQ